MCDFAALFAGWNWVTCELTEITGVHGALERAISWELYVFDWHAKSPKCVWKLFSFNPCEKCLQLFSKRVLDIFDFGQYVFHSVETTEYFCHSNFTWNQGWRIQNKRNYCFMQLKRIWIPFQSKSAKINKDLSRAYKCVTMASFKTQYSPTLISRKM